RGRGRHDRTRPHGASGRRTGVGRMVHGSGSAGGLRRPRVVREPSHAQGSLPHPAWGRGMTSIPTMSAPRQFLVPKTLCASGKIPERVTLDDMELLSMQGVDERFTAWASKVLHRENNRVLSEVLGSEVRLPRGVLASAVETGGAEVVTALVNHRGEVWHPSTGWTASAEPVSVEDTVDLDDQHVARSEESRVGKERRG